MYGAVLTLQPSGGLTFRRMPSGILHISTYPFVPPTTLSGWLRRLVMLSQGRYPNTSVKNPSFYSLSPDYKVMGAYPAPDPLRSYEIHTTYRQGVRDFKHNAFSRLVGARAKKEVYQLHTWDYLMVDTMRGFVLHKDQHALENLQRLVGLGCKLGKEGYAFLEQVEVVPVSKLTTLEHPSTLASAESLIGQPSTLFALYRYQYDDLQAEMSWEMLATEAPSTISGFAPIMAGWPDTGWSKLECWTDRKQTPTIVIPVSFVEALYGV